MYPTLPGPSGIRTNSMDQTVMPRAAAYGPVAQDNDLDVTEFLLTVNCLNLESADNILLHSAANNNNIKVAQFLISRGANARVAEGVKERTPLHIAIKKGHADMVALLAPVSDMHARDWTGLKPLHYAAQTGNVKIMKIISEYDKDLDAVCDDGMTALHYAASRAHVLCVLLLIERGADYTLRDHQGRTALDMVRAAVPDYLRSTSIWYRFDRFSETEKLLLEVEERSSGEFHKCALCKSDTEPGQVLVHVTCNDQPHDFHWQCLLLFQKEQCPLCKGAMALTSVEKYRVTAPLPVTETS